MPSPILQLNDVKTHFSVESGFIFQQQTGTVKAVDGVSLTVARGEVLGLPPENEARLDGKVRLDVVELENRGRH